VHLLLPAGGRMTKVEGRMSATEHGMPGTVRTEDIVAYLEKRFEPPPEDERLKLDEPSEVKMQSAKCKVQNGIPKSGDGTGE